MYGSWSWGGYLTTWTIGHTNRYRAAVVGAGITDVVLQYATSDINHGAAGEWEYRGNPWLQPDHFARANPLHSLAKIRTPTLIHGENDERVPANAILLYRALKTSAPGAPRTYPDEPHGFQNPAHIAHMWSEGWRGIGRSSAADASGPFTEAGGRSSPCRSCLLRKKTGAPSDSSPDTPTRVACRASQDSPFQDRLASIALSPSQVPCQSSPFGDSVLKCSSSVVESVGEHMASRSRRSRRDSQWKPP